MSATEYADELRTGNVDALEGDGEAGAAGQDRQFVTFEVAGEMFAVPMAMVQEIIRVPEVARLPLAPNSLAGLANLRGRILPVLNLRRLFNVGEVEPQDANRVLVIKLGQSLGFMVDRVASVVSVPVASIEATDTLQSIVSADYLAGAIRHDAVSDGRVVPLIDFERLADREFTQVRRAAASAASFADADARQGSEMEDDGLRLVSFSVAGQEYAIDIADVREIVQMPERVTNLPNTAAHVQGVITLRQRLLPLVSLRALFGLPVIPPEERHRVVVVSQPGGAQVGLVTDAVREVLSVPREQADAMPALLAQDEQMREFASICRMDGGKRLVSIISTARLLGLPEMLDAVAAAVATGTEVHIDEEDAGGEGEEDVTQVVVFRLGAEEFGVPIASVQEIVRVPETLSRVPRTPDFVAGVINLRGGVLPVIDQRRRLGMAEMERNDSQRIVVHAQGGARTGFIVDSVAEVLRIPLADVEDAPDLSEGAGGVVTRIAKLAAANRMIMLIDPARFLEAREIGAVKRLVAEAAARVPEVVLPLARAA
jgi:purine-binding chemotaxis protein CheW